MTTATDTAPITQPFQAEVSELLHLMVHSVYSETDIFLRELISNASDACDKLRYEAIAKPELIGDGEAPKIRIIPDKKAGTLTVADTGIGMDRQELIDNLGTIARSGTKAFVAKLAEAKDGAGLIGQFGVGFYSAFMVADRIVVTSRRAGASEVWTWSSSGGAGFEVAPASEEDAKRVDARHRDRAASERGRQEISRNLRDRAHRRRLFRQHPVPDRARARRGRAAPDQFGERAVAAVEIRTEAGGLHAGLQVDRERLRRAGDDAALPRRGPLLLRGAAVRAVDQAVRPVRAGAQGQGEALCAARLHHRRCRSAAGLSALHPRRDRQRGPAAQHLPRDAAEQSAARADQEGRRPPASSPSWRRWARRSRRTSTRSGTPSAPSSRKASTRISSGARSCWRCRGFPRPPARSARSSNMSRTSSPTRPKSISWSATASSG